MEHVQARDAKNNFGNIMRAADRGESTVITHYLEPRAVVVPYARWRDAEAVMMLPEVAALLAAAKKEGEDAWTEGDA